MDDIIVLLYLITMFVSTWYLTGYDYFSMKRYNIKKVYFFKSILKLSICFIPILNILYSFILYKKTNVFKKELFPS